jgi:hypothetical protein
MAVKLVLLHSPLVGPGTWRSLAPSLRAQGREIAVADFAADMSGDPPYYAKLVRTACRLLNSESNAKTLLVVHSGAGSLVPAIAALGGVAGAVFVDALMPHPRESWIETIPESLKVRLERSGRDGRVPPWHRWWPDGAIRALFSNQASYDAFVSELKEIPLDFLREPAPGIELQDDLRASYLQLGPGNASEASRAERLGWPVRRLAMHHLAVITHPEQVADGIGELVSAST